MFNRACLISIVALFFMPKSFAVQSINVQTFNPSTSSEFVLLEDGLRTEWPHQAKYYLGANYNYVHTPFVINDPGLTIANSTIIDSIQSFDFFFGFKPDKQLGLYFGMPIHSVSYSDSNVFRVTGNKTVLGDAKIMAKVRLNRNDENTSFAVIPEVHLPTGSTENFVSDASTYLALRMSVERVFERWTMALNGGFAISPNNNYAYGTTSLDMRKRLLLGVGGFVPFTDQWGMSVEWNSQIPVPFNNSINPNEAYAGLRYLASNSLAFTGGASLAKIGGPPGQDYRIILGVRYALLDEKAAPLIRPAPVAAAPAPPSEPVAAAPPIPEPTPWPIRSPTPVAIAIPPAPAPLAVIKDDHIEVRPVNFLEGSDKLTGDANKVLNNVATVIKANNKTIKKVFIDGHTDNIGGTKANVALSMARATAVRKYLIKKGIAASKIEARGFGESRPKVPYSVANAHEVNRRVEFIIVK